MKTYSGIFKCIHTYGFSQMLINKPFIPVNLRESYLDGAMVRKTSSQDPPPETAQDLMETFTPSF